MDEKKDDDDDEMDAESKKKEEEEGIQGDDDDAKGGKNDLYAVSDTNCPSNKYLQLSQDILQQGRSNNAAAYPSFRMYSDSPDPIASEEVEADDDPCAAAGAAADEDITGSVDSFMGIY